MSMHNEFMRKSMCWKIYVAGGYVVRAQEWLLWSRGAYGAEPAERGRVRWIAYKIDKDGDDEQ